MGDFDGILLNDVDYYLAEYGEVVTVTPPSGAARSCTAIVMRQPPEMKDAPREQQFPVVVVLPTNSEEGISPTEGNDRFQITLPTRAGSTETMTVRTVKPVTQDAAMIAWGCR
jgi:hypothetical protein